jgi:predicted MFS family arabinose efflux permease
MVLGGLAVSAVAYLAFSITGSTLLLAALVVIVWIASFEVTIVAAIPFASEMAVGARERLLSLFAVMIALGRAIGAIMAQPLYSFGGIGLVGFVSAGCVVAAILLLLAVKEHDAAVPGAFRPS